MRIVDDPSWAAATLTVRALILLVMRVTGHLMDADTLSAGRIRWQGIPALRTVLPTLNELTEAHFFVGNARSTEYWLAAGTCAPEAEVSPFDSYEQSAEFTAFYGLPVVVCTREVTAPRMRAR